MGVSPGDVHAHGGRARREPSPEARGRAAPSAVFPHRAETRLQVQALAARGATPSAFERRCIPAGCVAPPSNISDILSRRVLPSGRLAALGATMELHHGLPTPVMKLPFRTRIGTAAIGCIAAVVVALAVIQYRWNQEASDATGVRLADSLQLSMINWHLDLFRNLSEVCVTMRTTADHGAQIDQWVDRLAEWRSLARYPDLVANVYLLRRRAPDRVDLVPVVAGAPTLERERWPRSVEQIAGHLDHSTAEPADGAATSGRQLTESFYNIGSALRVWRFDPTAPALVRTTGTTRTTADDAEWLIVELNEEVLR